MVPTKDRSDQVRRLLRELVVQEELFSEGIPIYIIDASTPNSAHEICKEFRGRLPLFYFGSEERNKLIKSISKDLDLAEVSVADIFSRGYGGNRNAALSQALEDTVISCDDDILPYSFGLVNPPQTSPESAEAIDQGLTKANEDRDVTAVAYFLTALLGGSNGNNNPLIGLKYEVHKNAGKPNHYNLFSDLTKDLGRSVKELSYPIGSRLDFRKIGNGEERILLEPARVDGITSSVILSFPLISGTDDLIEPAQGKTSGVVGYSGLRPSVLINHPVSYCCYGTLNKVLGKIPFVPTALRCEDTLHWTMNQEVGNGVSLMIGNDILHDPPERLGSNSQKMSENECCCVILQTMVIKTLREVQGDNYDVSPRVMGLGKLLPAVADRKNEVRDLIGNALLMLAKNRYIGANLPSPSQIPSIELKIKTEVEYSSFVFKNWSRIREYILDNPSVGNLSIPI